MGLSEKETKFYDYAIQRYHNDVTFHVRVDLIVDMLIREHNELNEVINRAWIVKCVVLGLASNNLDPVTWMEVE